MQVPALDFCVRPRWEPLKDHLGVCTCYRIQIQVRAPDLLHQDPLGFRAWVLGVEPPSIE